MNAQLTLLDVPKDHPSVREQNAVEVRTLKEKHSIFTHSFHERSDQGRETSWMAFPILLCHEALSGYLNDEDRKDPFLMFSGYCRLIEETGLIADHCPTELEACREVVKIVERFS